MVVQGMLQRMMVVPGLELMATAHTHARTCAPTVPHISPPHAHIHTHTQTRTRARTHTHTHCTTRAGGWQQLERHPGHHHCGQPPQQPHRPRGDGAHPDLGHRVMAAPWGKWRVACGGVRGVCACVCVCVCVEGGMSCCVFILRRAVSRVFGASCTHAAPPVPSPHTCVKPENTFLAHIVQTAG